MERPIWRESSRCNLVSLIKAFFVSSGQRSNIQDVQHAVFEGSTIQLSAASELCALRLFAVCFWWGSSVNTPSIPQRNCRPTPSSFRRSCLAAVLYANLFFDAPGSSHCRHPVAPEAPRRNNAGPLAPRWHHRFPWKATTAAASTQSLMLVPATTAAGTQSSKRVPFSARFPNIPSCSL